MEKEKDVYMIPITETFTSYEHKNCTYVVHGLFCGWESIIPRLQELMVDRLIEDEQPENLSA